MAKANNILGHIKQCCHSSLREMTKVFHSALVRPNLECHIQFWILQKNRDMGLVERAWQRAIKMPKGLEHLSCEERLRAEESVHSWEKAWRGSCQCVQIPGGREYRSQSQTSHWCPVNIWEARGTNGNTNEVPFKHKWGKKNLLLTNDGTQVAQRSCEWSLHPWRYSESDCA